MCSSYVDSEASVSQMLGALVLQNQRWFCLYFFDVINNFSGNKN